MYYIEYYIIGSCDVNNISSLVLGVTIGTGALLIIVVVIGIIVLLVFILQQKKTKGLLLYNDYYLHKMNLFLSDSRCYNY